MPLVRSVRAAFVASAALLLAAPLAAQQTSPPRARIVPKVDTAFGDVRTDNYFWLRDRTNPETIAYLEAENAWTAQGMKPTEGLQQAIYKEIVSRIKESDLSVPYRQGGWWYYTRTEAGKSYPIHCRKLGSLSAKEEVIFDENEMAKGKKFYGLGGLDVSPDGRYLLFLEDTTALRYYTLRVKDLRTGEILPDHADSVTGGTAWASDNATFFYTLPDSARRDYAVRRHVLGGGDMRQDPVVVQENDVLYSVNLRRLRSGRFIAITTYSYTDNETRLIDAAHPDQAPALVEPRRPNVEYQLDNVGDRFFIVTNDGGAQNFKVMTAPTATPDRAHWTAYLPYDPAVFTERVQAFRSHLVLEQRVNGLSTFRVVNLATKKVTPLRFPEAAYGVDFQPTPDFASPTFRYAYSSLVTPRTIYDYDFKLNRSELQKREPVLGYDPSKYGVARFDVKARDGAMVPVSLVYRKPLVKDGKRPLLLYAYGSYGYVTEPEFNTAVFSMVDRGVIYAIAHIRGGSDKGRPWYDDGKMLKKKNTFNDYVDVAQALVDQRWTSPSKLVANGGSAGGLLMGAVVNQRPDLFKAVVADVPFVDVINTMRDASIPLTANEWRQWGDPLHHEDEYRYMLSYSPYDNVEAKAYPWMLVTTSLNDSQVAYWEPAKWTAKLRVTKTDANPLYLKTNMAGGHGGSSGRYDRYKEVAFRYAFMLQALGMAPTATP